MGYLKYSTDQYLHLSLKIAYLLHQNTQLLSNLFHCSEESGQVQHH